jgi:hypothetical protein
MKKRFKRLFLILIYRLAYGVLSASSSFQSVRGDQGQKTVHMCTVVNLLQLGVENAVHEMGRSHHF